MPIYEDSLKMSAARDLYFAAWGLDAGSYTAKWVTLKSIGPIRLGFPNTAGRRRTVKMHDLHHVLTGYDANWIGEAEIGAWEVGAGCHRHLAAWVLNLSAMLYGAVLAPSRVLRAFARGRQSETLYRSRELDESLLDETVGDIRRRLKIDRERSDPGPTDVILLACWWIGGWLLVASPLLVLAKIMIA